MKFYAAVAAYVFIGVILGIGVYRAAVHGQYWFLAVGTLAYLGTMIKLGCLPAGDSHH